MKLIKSNMKMNHVGTENRTGLSRFEKTKTKLKTKPNEDGTVTVMSYGERKIDKEWYKFEFERTYDITDVQHKKEELRFFKENILKDLDEHIFLGNGDNNDNVEKLK